MDPKKSAPVCAVAGCSRGLGAALVAELLRRKLPVLGISRKDETEVRSALPPEHSRNYTHLRTNIADEGSVAPIQEAAAVLGRGPLIVLFNAAHLAPDIREDGSFDLNVFNEVNRVAVTGFGHVLNAFERKFTTDGGQMIGISSINALKPAVLDARIAYPASKAYMTMALRALAAVRGPSIRCCSLHLGHIGGPETASLPQRWINPSYRATAEWIVRRALKGSLPSEAIYPLAYRIAYRGVLNHLPDPLYARLLSMLLTTAPSVRTAIAPDPSQGDAHDSDRRRL